MANVVVDSLSGTSIGNFTHVKDKKKELSVMYIDWPSLEFN